jgi:methylmalonyl-CoA carboxyltransferase 5S subunit
MFPQVAPKFFKSRSEGPKNVGTDPAKKGAPAESLPQANGKQRPAETSVNYVITLNGKEHRVSVAPAN